MPRARASSLRCRAWSRLVAGDDAGAERDVPAGRRDVAAAGFFEGEWRFHAERRDFFDLTDKIPLDVNPGTNRCDETAVPWRR
jgi:hypothetical protein